MPETIRNVILVHGAFADGSSWANLILPLRERGLNVFAVQNRLTSLADDVASVRRTLQAVPGPTVLVGHSWGGAVITEAGNDDKVAGLVYVAAVAPDAGESWHDWWKAYPPSEAIREMRLYGGDDFLVLTAAGVRNYFAQDVSEEAASLMEAVQGPFAKRCFDDKITTAAWRLKPSWYIVAENDRTISPLLEFDSAMRMKAKVLALPSSHVVMIAHPQRVAEFIAQAVSALNGRTGYRTNQAKEPAL